MTAFRARLTEVDIRRLIKATDDDERAEAAHKLCRNMERAELDGLVHRHLERDDPPRDLVQPREDRGRVLDLVGMGRRARERRCERVLVGEEGAPPG